MFSPSSSSSSASASFSPDHHLLPPTSDQLCYVHCNFCDTILAVSVPCSSLFKTVAVRCGHCTNLLSVNMRALLLPNPTAVDSIFSPQNLLEEIRNAQSNMFDQLPIPNQSSMMPLPRLDDHPKPPPTRGTEKRQRVPSAYNRFIKEEIQRIKAENPDINHREAFSAAAKNWAHFPHIQFGFMPDQPVIKKTIACQQDGEDMLMKDHDFLAAAAAANQMGVYPY